MFELSGVSKRYGSMHALRGVDLAVEPGRATVVIGPSGCGKSTLLRVMIGLLRPDAGRVRFDGQIVGEHNALELRRRMGYVIQEGGLFPHLSARDNVTLMARHLGQEKGRIEERLAALIDRTQLSPEILDRFPIQLSGGERQRVSLMRALFLDPAVLLLDEPLGSLDPMVRGDLQDQLREIFLSLGKTVVLVTHDLGEAGLFGDTVVLLREGEIVQEGRFQDLLDAPADSFARSFVTAQRRTHLGKDGS